MEFYELWDIESYLREMAEFVNLFSRRWGCRSVSTLLHFLEKSQEDKLPGIFDN